MIYSVPYILLIALYGFMAWWYDTTKVMNNRTWNIAICMGATLLFWGFRGFVFYDWMGYYPWFLELNLEDPFSSVIWGKEPGFALLMTISKALFNNYHFFVFLCSAINLALLSRFILKHISNFPLGMFICTCICGIFLFTDLMRNAIAIFAFINGIDYIAQRKPLKYFAVCLVAISFHYSSAIYILLYFFAHRRIRKWVFAVVFFAGCAVFALKIPLLSDTLVTVVSLISPELEEMIHFYLTEIANKAPGLNFVFFERVFTGILVICYMDKLRSLRHDADVYINSMLIFMGVNFYLHEFVTFSFRLSLLFSFGYWTIWPDLIKCFSHENNKKLFVIFILGYCFLRTYGHTRNVLAHYDNILFETDTFEQRQSIFNKNYEDQ